MVRTVSSPTLIRPGTAAASIQKDDQEIRTTKKLGAYTCQPRLKFIALNMDALTESRLTWINASAGQNDVTNLDCVVSEDSLEFKPNFLAAEDT